MTRKQFQTKAEATFLKANPTATVTGWVKAPRLITYPTGLREWGGTFHAVAVGYKPSLVIASGDDTHMMVR